MKKKSYYPLVNLIFVCILFLIILSIIFTFDKEKLIVAIFMISVFSVLFIILLVQLLFNKIVIEEDRISFYKGGFYSEEKGKNKLVKKHTLFFKNIKEINYQKEKSYMMQTSTLEIVSIDGNVYSFPLISYDAGSIHYLLMKNYKKYKKDSMDK